MREAWSRTLALYQSTFDVEPPAEIWPHSKSEIGIRYRDVEREDANPAHRRFDCRRPKLADLERLNGTSHRFEAVKVRLPKWQWKRLLLLPISLIFAFATVFLILAVGSSASSNNASVVFSNSSGIILSFCFLFFIFTFITVIFRGILFRRFNDYSFLYAFVSTIYAKVKSIQDNHIKKYGNRLTVTQLRQSRTIHDAIYDYIKSSYPKESSLGLLSSHAKSVFFDIYAKAERRTATTAIPKHAIRNAIQDHISSQRSSRAGCGGGCGG